MNGDLNSLWEAVSNQFDIGNFQEFSSKMQTVEDRKSFFDSISTKIDIGGYEEFESKLETPTAESTTGTRDYSFGGGFVGEDQEMQTNLVKDEKGEIVEGTGTTLAPRSTKAEVPFKTIFGVNYRENGTVIKDQDYLMTEEDKNKKIETISAIIDANIKHASIPLQAATGVFKGIFGEDQRSEDFVEIDKYKDLFGVDFISDIGNTIKTDYSRSKGVQASLNVQEALHQNKIPNSSDLKEIVKNTINVAALPPTDEVRAYGEIYETNKEKYGGTTAWFMAVGQNPSFLAQTTAGSMANIIGTFINSSTARKRALAGGTAAGTTALALGQLVPMIPEELVTIPTAVLSTMFGTLSGTMEQSYTFVELAQEQLEQDGLEFTPENVQELFTNEEIVTFKDPRFKSLNITGTRAEIMRKRSFRRGMAIGFVDAATGLIMGKSGSTFIAPIAGGVTSEVSGQTAGGQEYEAGEILTEGFAEKGLPVAIASTTVKKLINPPKYQINGQTFNKNNFNAEIAKMSDHDIALANIKIENDQVKAKALFEKQQNAVLETQVNEKIEDVTDRKEMVNLEKQRVKAESDAKKKGIKAVPGAKETLENIEMKMNEIVGKYTAIDGRIKVVRDVKKKAQDVRTRLDEISTEATKVAASKNTATIKKQMEAVDKKTGRKGQVIEMNSEDIAESAAETVSLFEAEVEGFNQKLNNIKDKKSQEYKDTQGELNFFQEQLDGIKAADKEFGYIVDYADGNYDVILNKDKPMVGTAAHEFQHKILSRTLKNNQDIQNKVGDALIEYVTGKFGGVSPAFINRMKAYINPKTGKQDAAFGEEIVTVMSESILDGSLKYNENLFTKIGDVVRQTLQRVGAIDVKFNTGKDVYNFIKDYNRSIEKDYASKAITKMAAEGAKGKLVEGETKTGPTIKMSKDASNNVQRIYEEQGEAGAFDIIDQFKPIVGKIVQRRSEAPNFDRQLLTDEIETGKRGIYDLIKEYNLDSGVPLAAYINKYLPARAIEASKRILGEEFTQDISERVDIVTEEVMQEPTKPKRKKVVLAERLGVTDKVSKAIQKLIPSLNLDNLNFKTLKNKIPEITGELFGISSKKLISNANITKKELQSAQMFINKNADVLLAMLPEGSTPSGTATGVPKTLLKAFYTKSDRAKMAKTGTKAGLAVQVKKPNISKTEFLEVFGIIDGKPIRTDRNTSARVLALANQTGKMITNQTVRQELLSKEYFPVTQEQEIVNRLREGKSKIMFSKESDFSSEIENSNAQVFIDNPYLNPDQKIDPLLKSLIGEGIHDLNTREGIDTFAKDIEEIGVPIMPEGFIDRGLLRKSNRIFDSRGGKGYINVDGVKMTIDQYYTKWRDTVTLDAKKGETGKELNERRKKLGLKSLKFGKPFTGAAKNWKPKVYKTLGETANQIDASNKSGKLKKFNDANMAMHEQAWERINNSIKSNPKKNARVWGNIFKFTGLHSTHFHRQGSEVIGWSTNPKGKLVRRKQKDGTYKMVPQLYEWEHAMPASDSYLYLIEISINKGNFKDAYGLVVENSKVIALDAAENTKLNDAKLGTGMQEGWNFIDNLFVDRYFNPEVAGQKSGTKTFGIDPKGIKHINGKTFAEQYNVNTDGNPAIVKTEINKNKQFSKAIDASRITKEPKGITVLDFDDTLATSKSNVLWTAPDGTTGKLTAEEFAKQGADLLAQGYVYDFSEFNKVVKGKKAPLFEKALKLQGKFGPESMFVLTARPAESAQSIFDFLKANGLNIPIKNITGLANSTSEAKALWMADKVADGYNDFYFADDALQNVQAVKNMLEQFDVKSKVQQARVKFSESMNDNFNDILENVTGIESNKRFSAIKARKRGDSKGKFRFFIPPSHEDFVGLLYNFIGKGKEGNTHRDFFEKALIRPLNRAYRELNTAKQSIANDYKSLNKEFEDVKKKLTKKTPDGDFTYQDAIRVYLWNKHDHKVPGLSPTDQTKLTELVMSDPNLQTYAETLNVISKQETYVKPTESWEAGDIRMDLDDATGRVGREQYFAEFNENSEIIFSEENLNKIEAAYGEGVRSAIEDSLYRTKTGRNRPSGQNKLTNRFLNYLNGSVASTMFVNVRSALLQQMSIVNFINYGDNNVLMAAKAFANLPQYFADWATIFNSDFMKQRRGGIKTDVNGAELAASLKGAKNTPRALLGKLLELGFLPTQIGDNFAIATGGAPFYRNRINTYKKQGLSQKEAESKAWIDFQGLAEATQQSARPDMVSQQQASPLGKIILAFQNVTSQFNRLGKKAFLDIKNRRITPGNPTQLQSDMSNVSRIAYYFAVQNIIFYSLQTALFAMMFDDDADDEKLLKKQERVINGSIDSVLRGTGVMGAVIATLKNMAIKFAEQREKGYNADESAVLMEALNVSPPLGIKARKLVNAEKTLNYNRKVIDEMETFDIDNPIWSATTNIIEATTNAPLNRMYNKTVNTRNALDSDYTAFQRAMFISGYTTWSLDLGDTEKMTEIKATVKGKKEKSKDKKIYKRKTYKRKNVYR